jgi:DNA-directed RNA polymerase subunit M/transcription elongation factor TFIIS
MKVEDCMDCGSFIFTRVRDRGTRYNRYQCSELEKNNDLKNIKECPKKVKEI